MTLPGIRTAIIGFTMAIFIAGLALDAPHLDVAMVGVLGASVVAASLGMAGLLAILPKPANDQLVSSDAS